MPLRLDMRARDFRPRFDALLSMKREQSEDVGRTVSAIIADVRARGDAAVADYTRRFDHHEPGPQGYRVPAGRLADAAAGCDADILQALKVAARRIADHHRRQRPGDETYVDADGVTLGHRWTAVDAVGLYVPGGLAAYPSSVLMNAIPAKVAGVPRLVITVPAPDGEISPLVLAAAHLAGVDEVHAIGGAQAVAALAFGTGTIRPVSKVVGPGNAYVAEAKRQVFGIVGIDMIAGPSEVLVLADADNDPAWIAADLLAQAEHDAAAQSILITDDADFAEAVERAVERQLQSLPRAEIAGASWRDYGAVILAPSLTEAVPLVDAIAPEHLEIATRDPDALAVLIRNAGAIFLGAHTPEAVGDYIAGTNHVLPTARSARFASGLGVLDFMKRTSILRCDAKALAAIGGHAITLGRAEGLEAHARSVAVRLGLT